jgi:hypothetical protein
MKAFMHSGRRAFLRGIGGTALALPLLEYTHGHVWAAAADGSLRRFLTVFSHGGTITNQAKGGKHDGLGSHHGEDWWRPADPTAPELVLGPIHAPLEPWKSKLLVLDGIDNKAAIEQDQYGAGGHGIANATALTAADVQTVVSGDDEDTVAMGPSIDEVAAQRLAAHQPVPFDRIHLKVKGHQYGSPYYRSAGEQVGGDSSPLEAFASIFDGVTGEEGPSPEVLKQIAMRGSALDGLLESYERTRTRVSKSDQHVIDAHLEHLRALEQELQNPIVCTPPMGIDQGDDQPGNVVGPLHARIIVAALRCGLTNVANLEIADILTPWTPVGTPIDSAFEIGHSLGHYAREVGPTGTDAGLLDTWLEEMLDNRRWRISLLAELLEGLDDPAFMEGDRTLLDNSLVLYTSEFRDPAGHIAWNVPVLLAGSAGGYFQTGRFIDYNVHAAGNPSTLEYQSPESTHNLFTSILHALGEDDAHFGSDHAEHEGPLPGLTA